MTFRHAAVATAFAVLSIAGCAGATAPTATTTPAPAPTTTPTPVPTAAPSPTPVGSQTVLVTLHDDLSITPAQMTVRVDVPVTFIVTNAGAVDHEFYLGDMAMQDEHEDEMAQMGGMMAHDKENGIALDPGETKELTYTFDAPGTWFGGCHVAGHYPAGMKATIAIAD